jgi:hypothetical protein
MQATCEDGYLARLKIETFFLKVKHNARNMEGEKNAFANS